MDYDTKEHSKTTPNKSDEEFLRKKRNIRALKENFIFRRCLTGKIYGKYENCANNYNNMMAFNWDDEKLLRNRNQISI